MSAFASESKTQVSASAFVFAGFLGSLLDSIIGLLFQAKYKRNGQITDIESVEFVGGYRFVTNDMVNDLSNVIVVGICWFFIFKP